MVDAGTIRRGTDEIRRFLPRAGAEFRYTTRLVGVERADAAHWVARHRLEGDVPGGLVDLAYRFALDGDLVRARDRPVTPAARPHAVALGRLCQVS